MAALFKHIAGVRGWVFLAAVFVYLISVIIPWPPLQESLPYLSIAALLTAWPAASAVSKGLTFLFLAAGTALVWTGHPGPRSVIQSFGSMLNLLSLFSVVPILAIPIVAGDYQQAVERLFEGRHLSPRRLYLTIAGLSYLLASLMNIAAIPMMYQSVARLVEQRRIPEPTRFLMSSIVVGYAMPLAWSPIAAVVAAIVDITGIRWAQAVPVTLALSFAGLAIGVAIFRITGSNQAAKEAAATAASGPPSAVPPAARQQSAAPAPSADALSEFGRPIHGNAAATGTAVPARSGKLWHIGLAVVLFFAAMQSLQSLTGWAMIEVIAILAMPFAWLWSLLLGRQPIFWKRLAQQRKSVQALHNTFSVFTAAGYFVQCLHQSTYVHAFDTAFIHASWAIGPTGFVALVPIVTVVLSLVGLHPVVTISLLGAALTPSVLHVSPIWLAIGLFGGGVTSFVLSPFNATANVAASVSGVQPSEIIRWNAAFSILFLLFVAAVAAAGQWSVTLR
ncbi:MAG: hypothetical protein IRZ33_01530 [Alicyclobacillaceae bacterium]|nr:hypothetical protein [Alicyclobacillaceae bacterium]